MTRSKNKIPLPLWDITATIFHNYSTKVLNPRPLVTELGMNIGIVIGLIIIIIDLGIGTSTLYMCIIIQVDISYRYY